MAEYITKIGTFPDRDSYLEFRAELQRAISERKKEVVMAEIRIEAAIARAQRYCAHCKCDLDSWTAGCKRCQQRHYARLKRGAFPGGLLAFCEIASVKAHAALSLALERRNGHVYRIENTE